MITLSKIQLEIVSNQNLRLESPLSRRAIIQMAPETLVHKVKQTFSYIGDGFSDPEAIAFTSAKAISNIPDFCKTALAEMQTSTVENFYTSTKGEDSLLKTLSLYGKKLELLHTEEKNIVITAGAVNAFFSLCHALCDEGDVFLALSPSYILFSNAVHTFGGEMVLVPSQLHDKFRVTAQTLQNKIQEVITSGKKIKAVFVVNPTNIDSQCWTHEDIAELAPIIAEHELIVIEDRVYDGLQYDPPANAAFFAQNENIANRVITIDSVSKRYGATQWRIGWLYAPEPIASACRASVMQTVWSPNSNFQSAAALLISSGLKEKDHLPSGLCIDSEAHEKYFTDIHSEYKIRRDLCLYLLNGEGEYSFLTAKGHTEISALHDKYNLWLRKYFHLKCGIEGFSLPIIPQAGMFALIQANQNIFDRFAKYNNPDLVFARLLYKAGGVMMLPPTELTLPESERMFRMEFGVDIESLFEGLSRIDSFAKLIIALTDAEIDKLVCRHMAQIPEAFFSVAG